MIESPQRNCDSVIVIESLSSLKEVIIKNNLPLKISV